MNNRYGVRVKQGLKVLLRKEKDPKVRSFIQGLLDDLENCVFSYEQQIQAAKMIGVRNPFFDGDEIGYPEDDFDDDHDFPSLRKR
jgi:hypothetical protein